MSSTQNVQKLKVSADELERHIITHRDEEAKADVVVAYRFDTFKKLFQASEYIKTKDIYNGEALQPMNRWKTEMRIDLEEIEYHTMSNDSVFYAFDTLIRKLENLDQTRITKLNISILVKVFLHITGLNANKSIRNQEYKDRCLEAQTVVNDLNEVACEMIKTLTDCNGRQFAKTGTPEAFFNALCKFVQLHNLGEVIENEQDGTSLLKTNLYPLRYIYRLGKGMGQQLGIRGLRYYERKMKRGLTFVISIDPPKATRGLSPMAVFAINRVMDTCEGLANEFLNESSNFIVEVPGKGGFPSLPKLASANERDLSTVEQKALAVYKSLFYKEDRNNEDFGEHKVEVIQISRDMVSDFASIFNDDGGKWDYIRCLADYFSIEKIESKMSDYVDFKGFDQKRKNVETLETKRIKNKDDLIEELRKAREKRQGMDSERRQKAKDSKENRDRQTYERLKKQFQESESEESSGDDSDDERLKRMQINKSKSNVKITSSSQRIKRN